MSGRKNSLVILGFVISVSFMASALTATLVSRHYSRLQFELLNTVCGEVLEQGSEAGKTVDAISGEPSLHSVISAALKEYTNGNVDGTAEKEVLSALGYRASDFSPPSYRRNAFFAAAGFLTGILLFLLTFLYRNKKEAMRIQALADYLEQVNTGRAPILSMSGEDAFSKLEDEIYKTVTFLYQTKDAAVRAKNDFAENLSNIAHQIKTPITAISLSVQMMQENFDNSQPEKIKKQLLRLTYLEEALLVLSRIDAGTLLLQEKEVDVFTLLVLAADNLQELFAGYDTSIDIPELGGMAVTVDLDWTMEALMNLMKNCMEHGNNINSNNSTNSNSNHSNNDNSNSNNGNSDNSNSGNGGIIHCSYAQNPLYTEILIWDEGKGFEKEDIPHLFERFYRGRNAGEGGIGIGLALSKEIIERQNGTIRAKNIPSGGALFEIRFYSH